MPPAGPVSRLVGTFALAREAAGQARFPFRPIADIRRAQSRRLERMVAHAYRSVPFWREAMRSRGLSPADIRTVDDLGRLPIVERADLQRDPERFRSEAFRRDDLLELRSGGSSGEPIRLWYDIGSLIANAAHGERERAIWRGTIVPGTGYREALVIPPFNAAVEVQRFVRERAWIPARVDVERRYFPMLDPVPSLIERLNAFAPHVLSTYGSFVETLFATVEASGAAFHLPSVVLYGADGVSEAARARIAARFGVPVLCAYQSIEAFKIAFECERHDGLHANVDLYPLRLDGPDGEVIVSNLVNRATVLLNYRLGDVIVGVDGPCACGRTLPRVSRPQGRSDDFLDHPSGLRVHPQAVRSIFTAEPGVWQYQVDQLETARFDVRVVASADCDRPATGRRIVAALRALFGAATIADVAFVERLERTPWGKLRPIRSFRPGR